MILKRLTAACAVMISAISCADISDLEDRLDSLESRVKAIENIIPSLNNTLKPFRHSLKEQLSTLLRIWVINIRSPSPMEKYCISPKAALE